MNKIRLFGGLAAIVLAGAGILEFRSCEEKEKITEIRDIEVLGKVSITADPYKVGEFYAERYHVPPAITLGTITVESKGRHYDSKGKVLKGNDGERGIIQIKQDFVEDIIKALSLGFIKADETNWNDVVNQPAENIRAGVLAHRLILRKLRDMDVPPGNSEPLTILGYNAGWPTAVIKARERDKSFRKVVDSFDNKKRKAYLGYIGSVIGYGRTLDRNLQSPTNGKLKITSNYGMRKHPKLKIKRHHDGIDIQAKEGEKILSPDDLIVKNRGLSSSRGHYIDLKTETKEGFYIQYKFNHCRSIKVRRGDKTKRGQLIANVGHTGLATGPHIHLEVSAVYSPQIGDEVEILLDPKIALGLRKPKPIRFSFDRDDALDFVKFSYRKGRDYAIKRMCNKAYEHLDNVIQTGVLTTLADDAALIAGDCFRKEKRFNESTQAYKRGIAFNGDMKVELEKRLN